MGDADDLATDVRDGPRSVGARVTGCGLSDDTCGRYSAIPPCCRDWFVRVWQPLFASAIAAQEPWTRLLARRFDESRGVVKYVQCPGCLATKAYVHIRFCEWPCEHRCLTISAP